MRSCASGVARLETVPALYAYSRLFCACSRSMNAQRRTRRSASLPRQLRNKVVWVRRLQFAGRVELRDLIRRKRPSDRAKVILELLHASRPDDWCGYTWLLQEPVNGHLGRVPLQGPGNFVQTIQRMPRLLVIVGTPFFALILLLREFDA